MWSKVDTVSHHGQFRNIVLSMLRCSISKLNMSTVRKVFISPTGAPTAGEDNGRLSGESFCRHSDIIGLTWQRGKSNDSHYILLNPSVSRISYLSSANRSYLSQTPSHRITH